MDLTKIIKGLEIFSTGEHTDSTGFTETFSGSDLDKMVDAFDAGDPWAPAVKLGHTSDEYNKAIAESMGVPVETLTGEEGNGVLALGEITKLKRRQNKLVADLEVQDAVAGWIDKGMLNDVSAEMILNDDGDWVISGLALLGAEAPAVDDLRGLGAAVVLKTPKNPKVLTPAHAYKRAVPEIVFQTNGDGIPMYEDSPAFARIVKVVKKALRREDKSMKIKAIKFEAEDLKKLGFVSDDDEDEEKGPTKEEVTSAIAQLQERADHATMLENAIGELAALIKSQADDDEDEDEDEKEESVETILESVKASIIKFQANAQAVDGKAAKAITTATKPLLKQIAVFKTEKRTAKFATRVEKLLIPGKTEDLLADLSEFSEAQAEVMLKTWEASSDSLRHMGVTKALGRAVGDDIDEGDPTQDADEEQAVAEYMRDHRVDQGEALKQVRWNAWEERNKKPEATKSA